MQDGENIMVILSSPSGVGKTTITKKIQQKYQSFKISVSHTTRSPRSNEVDGVDYHFVSHQKFEKLIKEKKFYEYAKIFENYYGTLKKNVDKINPSKFHKLDHFKNSLHKFKKIEELFLKSNAELNTIKSSRTFRYLLIIVKFIDKIKFIFNKIKNNLLR